MRLSAVLEEEDFKNAGIQIIGTWKTETAEFLILGPRGQSVFPINLALQHPIEIINNNRDPDLYPEEIASIRRRFGFGRPFIVR
jgi:hypothetical protein